MLALYDQAVVSGSNFLTMILIARQLRAEDFGMFSLAMMSMLFLGNLHRAIFTQPMNILGAGDAPSVFAGRFLALLKVHRFAIPIATAILAVISQIFFPETSLLVAVAIYVACYFLQEMLRRYWYTLRETDKALRNDLISYAGQVVIILLVGSFLPLDSTLAFSIMAFTSLFAFLAGLAQLRLPPSVERYHSWQVLVQQWTLAKWLILTVLAVWGAGQVYPFLIAPLGPLVVASFSACRNLLNALGIVIQSIGNYLPTHAAVLLQHGGKAALGQHICKTFIAVTALALAFLFVTQMYAEELLHLVFGGTYDSAAPLLKILAWGAVSTLFASALGSYSLAMGDSRSGFLANLAASAFTFTGGFFLIQTQGVTGAAIATTFSLATAMLIQGALVAIRYRRITERGTASA
jgi:O-antigen/teichoic acid export membrane protein